VYQILRLVPLSPQSTQSQNLSLRLLHGAASIGAVYVPSTMVASGGVASTACGSVSFCGRGVDSTTLVDRCSSPDAASGSSPSQIDQWFSCINTTSMIRHVRLSIYMDYSGIGYTHKLDRTTVTFRAPSMLAISTIPASTGASGSTWATTSSTAPVVAEGSGLPSSDVTRGSSVTAACYAASGTVASVVGAGLRLLSVAPPTVSQASSSSWSTRSDGGISYDNSRLNCQHAILHGKYSTTLLEELTSWTVDAATLSFLAALFHATLRGLLGGKGMLASKLAGLSTMRGILASPRRLNLDRS
jgi:hypothetical protein